MHHVMTRALPMRHVGMTLNWGLEMVDLILVFPCSSLRWDCKIRNGETSDNTTRCSSPGIAHINSPTAPIVAIASVVPHIHSPSI